MGLLLSVLVGCVGVMELLACLKHASDGITIAINPPTPCLSYHEPVSDVQSVHDSLCNFSHSADVRLPRGAKHKLENLHEYSLRVRNELRSLDKNFDCCTLSECSSRYLLGGSRPDSRLSPDSIFNPHSIFNPDSIFRPDFNYFVQEDDTWIVHVEAHDYDEYDETRKSLEEINEEIRESLRQVTRSLNPPEPEKYVRVPTPVPEKYVRIPTPFSLEEEKVSASSSELDISFDGDSGNEAPTMKFVEGPSRYRDSRSVSSVDESDHEERKVARIPPRKSPSRSPDPSRKPTKIVDVFIKAETPSDDLPKIDSAAGPAAESTNEVRRTFVSQRKPRSGKSSTTIVRKPTRLKSRNAEISKSAENLSTRTTKRDRDPERRKSDISVQTVRDLLRDMSTNTSPTYTPPLSRSESKKSVSVEVQTTLEDEEALDVMDENVVGLSESGRDLSSRGNFARKSFKSKRFRSNSRDSSDDRERQTSTPTNALSTVEKSRRDRTRTLKVSSFEDASEEDYDRIRSVILDSSKESNAWRRAEGSRLRSSLEEDDEFVDAEDVSSGRPPIQYTTPDTDYNKAFWVIHLTNEATC